MNTPDLDEPQYCGICGTKLLPNKRCPNKCTVVTYVHGSSPDYQTISLPPTEPSVPLYTPPPPPQSKSNKIYQIIIAVLLVIILIGAGVFAEIVRGENNSSAITGNTPNASNPAITTSANSTPTATPSPTPTFTPSPTPTSCPVPCVLYNENGSDDWQGWTLSNPWKTISGGLLVFPADTGQTGYALAPVDLTGVQNFDIVSSMRFPVGYATWGGAFDAFGDIIACYSGQTDYRGGIHFDNWNGWVFAAVQLTSDNDKKEISFQPGSNWHTYRLEVRGYKVSLFIDGSTVAIAQASDSQYTSCGNQVGLWSVRLNMEIRNFQVIEV